MSHMNMHSAVKSHGSSQATHVNWDSVNVGVGNGNSSNVGQEPTTGRCRAQQPASSGTSKDVLIGSSGGPYQPIDQHSRAPQNPRPYENLTFQNI